MRKLSFTLPLLLSFVVLSVGCDKLCKKTVEDVATIQNMTGHQISLNVCKGRTYGEAQIAIPANAISNEISLGTHEDSEVRGGPGASCSGVSNSKTTMSLSLSPNSFGQVKLCYEEASKTNLIVETSQSCPSGFLEQTSTGPCTL